VNSQTDLYIGLMSGTSLDGIDGVLATIDSGGSPSVLERSHIPYPPQLRKQLLELHHAGRDELHTAALLSNEMARLASQVVRQLLQRSSKTPREIAAIGSHGQTIRHRPELGYTLQLNAPALLAELTGIGVVADFRSRDIAAGGQGAPLVPAFHAQLFKHHMPCVILNLGGIANVTILSPEQVPVGFDTGPANMLMDAWCEMHTGKAFDENGDWGASGQPNQRLLEQLIAAEPWFSQPAPKSTGRDMFNLQWLLSQLETFAAALKPEDVQATLQHLTAKTVLDALAAAGIRKPVIYVCGGGAKNRRLLEILVELGATTAVPTDTLGVPAMDVEATAFAWLAWAFVHGKPGNLPQVTGASGPRVLGAYWPA